MTAPSKLAIFAAERRLQQARRDTYDSVSRLRTAVNLRLRRPSTIAWAAALGGAIAFALSHRHKTRRVRAGRADGATAGSIGAIVSAFLVRQAWQELSRMLFRIWTESRSPRFPHHDALHASSRLKQSSRTRRIVH
jgi:exonuclease I